ncbi:Gfo/Idh/MocA family oxidoreductase [Lacrimispora sp.]|uniref:Gfo/Idh/MocA family protein n=1 Tax=Lacrimispora sp. TaxID=2719234 RepID=UPI0032E3751A
MKRAAVIGLGDISSIHMMCIQNNPEITLAAVCDIEENKRDQAPEGVPFYTSYQDMISREKPDVVHICLPHYLHVPVSIAAAEMGVHVLCEKPVALNQLQGQVFADFEAAHPDIHMGICLQNRFNESVEALKTIIDSGKYGRVCAAKGVVPWSRSRDYYESKPWRGKWDTAGGGCMINQSVHTLDLLYYLGGPVNGVKASVSQLLDYGIEVEDTVMANLFYENGAHGLFMATNANYKNESVQISIQLDQAEFAIIENVLYRIHPDGGREQLAEDAKFFGSKFYYGASHGKLINKFYDSIEKDDQDYLHVKDGLMSIRLIDSIQESGRTGMFASLKEQ